MARLNYSDIVHLTSDVFCFLILFFDRREEKSQYLNGPLMQTGHILHVGFIMDSAISMHCVVFIVLQFTDRQQV